MTDSNQGRAISPEEGERLFAMYVDANPDLLDEVQLLSDGLPGVTVAIMQRMGESLSGNPLQVVTPSLIRKVVGAPDDQRITAEWRDEFIDTVRQERKGRSNPNQ